MEVAAEDGSPEEAVVDGSPEVEVGNQEVAGADGNPAEVVVMEAVAAGNLGEVVDSEVVMEAAAAVVSEEEAQ